MTHSRGAAGGRSVAQLGRLRQQDVVAVARGRCVCVNGDARGRSLASDAELGSVAQMGDSRNAGRALAVLVGVLFASFVGQPSGTARDVEASTHNATAERWGDAPERHDRRMTRSTIAMSVGAISFVVGGSLLVSGMVKRSGCARDSSCGLMPAGFGERALGGFLAASSVPLAVGGALGRRSAARERDAPSAPQPTNTWCPLGSDRLRRSRRRVQALDVGCGQPLRGSPDQL